jgi:hypothetical protein
VREIGWIRVASEPAGLAVIVDGDSAGVTPTGDMPVETGRHEVSVLPPGRRAFATRPFGRFVDVEAGEIEALFLRYPRVVCITSVPFGASAFLDGRPVGRTPFYLDLPEAGGGVVELRLSGHDPVRVPVEALRSGGPRWSAVFATVPDGAPLDSPRLGAGGWSAGRYALLAGAGAGALLGVHFKTVADDAYKDYKATGNLSKQRRLLDRSDRYDACSLAAWISAEALLGVTLAMLVRDQVRAGDRPARAPSVGERP